jgi:NADPH:quinone reductase-like Zn-dependent oxidoreductase
MAAGAVGSKAVQFAKIKGARVIGTASARNADFLRELGADEVIDYKKTRFEDVVHNVDVVFDTIGGDTQQRSWGVLKKGGILVSVVPAT